MSKPKRVVPLVLGAVLAAAIAATAQATHLTGFTVNPSKGDPPLDVTIADTTPGGPTNIAWDCQRNKHDSFQVMATGSPSVCHYAHRGVFQIQMRDTVNSDTAYSSWDRDGCNWDFPADECVIVNDPQGGAPIFYLQARPEFRKDTKRKQCLVKAVIIYDAPKPSTWSLQIAGKLGSREATGSEGSGHTWDETVSMGISKRKLDRNRRFTATANVKSGSYSSSAHQSLKVNWNTCHPRGS